MHEILWERVEACQDCCELWGVLSHGPDGIIVEADDHPGGPSQRQGGQEYRIAQEGRLGLRVHHEPALERGEQTCWLAG